MTSFFSSLVKLRALQDSSWSLSRPHVEVVDWQDASRIDLDTVYDKFSLFSSKMKGFVAGLQLVTVPAPRGGGGLAGRL
jgi:hypothetical protein